MQVLARSLMVGGVLLTPGLAQQTEAARFEPETWPFAYSSWGEYSAIDDPWMVVNGNGGVANAVYERKASGWVFRHFLRTNWLSGEASGTNFSIDGETLVVAQPLFGASIGQLRGKVQVYALVDGRWELGQELSPAGPAQNQWFGADVDVLGDVLAVGSSGVNTPYSTAGELQIFERVDDVWVQAFTLHQPDGFDFNTHPFSSLGHQVAVGKDVVVAGAGAGEGAFYVVEREPNGPWRRSQLVTRPQAPHLPKNFAFSLHVSPDGRVIVASDPWPDHGGFGAPPGEAFVFEKDGSDSWQCVQRIYASDGYASADAPEAFGYELATDGDRIVVGARRAVGTGSNDGAIYLFERNPDGSWPATETLRLTRQQGGGHAGIGSSVGLSGGFILAGAADEGSGAAYVFELEEGVMFCEQPPNSTGSPARLTSTWSGADEQRTVLSVRDCPPNEHGVFLISTEREPPARFHDGALCISSSEAARSTSLTTGSAGTAILDLGLGAFPGAGFLPGDVLYTQFVFGDPSSPTGVALSNASAVTVR